MKSGIYIIKNTINSKVYIGSAVNLKTRLKNHEYLLLKNKHGNIYLQRFVNKYGIGTLSFNTLETVSDKNKLIEREQFHIDSYEFSNLFNICKVAGSTLGRTHSAATRRKIGKSGKGRIVSEATKKKMSESKKGNTHSLGFKHTEITKKKISESGKGRKHSESTKKKISNFHKGRRLSEATKKKISKSLKGREVSKETRKKISKSGKGRIVSEATRKKISESKKGRIVSAATRKKLSKSGKGKKLSKEHRKKISESATKKIVLIFKDNVFIDTVIGVVVVAKKYNLNKTNISKVCLGKQKTTGGYTMKYERT